MATLTETAYYTRRAINWLILFVIFYILLRISWSLLVSTWLAVFPPKPIPPNHRFGKLPALVFPQQASPSADFSFRLETIEGTVPQASTSGMIYFMPKQAANLLGLTKTQDFAARLGLDPAPIAESKNIYRFNDKDLILRRLRYDLVSNNFILRYQFEDDTGLFTDHDLPRVDAAIAEATSLLQTYDLYNNDIARGATKNTFLKLIGNHLIPTTSLSQADSIRIDFFRRAIGDINVFTPNPDEGSVSVVFSGSKNPKKRILQFAYTFWPADYDTWATYQLKSSSIAWDELQHGKGFIARYPRTGNTAVVRNVYLGYYDTYDPQLYLQPIFVFEGDSGFLGYIPAVSGEWAETPAATNPSN